MTEEIPDDLDASTNCQRISVLVGRGRMCSRSFVRRAFCLAEVFGGAPAEDLQKVLRPVPTKTRSCSTSWPSKSLLTSSTSCSSAREGLKEYAAGSVASRHSKPQPRTVDRARPFSGAARRLSSRRTSLPRKAHPPTVSEHKRIRQYLSRTCLAQRRSLNKPSALPPAPHAPKQTLLKQTLEEFPGSRPRTCFTMHPSLTWPVRGWAAGRGCFRNKRPRGTRGCGGTKPLGAGEGAGRLQASTARPGVVNDSQALNPSGPAVGMLSSMPSPL